MKTLLLYLAATLSLFLWCFCAGCATGPDSSVNVSLWKSNTGESNTNDSTSSTSASVPVSALK